LAGDQHLGSFIQYGVDDWRDAGYAFCVPAISNVWPRRWFPAKEGKNRTADMPRYAGDFKDGFGNKISVHAVSNPFYSGKKPSRLYDRATGYGIVRFNRNSRNITVECWPRWADPSKPDAQQYPGWPVIVKQQDNYNRKAAAWLPVLKFIGLENPVVQVIDEKKDEIVYTIRAAGSSFRPKVFSIGNYTVFAGEPGTDKWQSIKGLKSVSEKDDRVVEIKF